MYHISGKKATELLSFDMLTDNGSGFERTLLYRKEVTAVNAGNSSFLLIAKKDKKLIINHNNNIFGFGFKDSTGLDIKNLLIHFQTASTHTFVAANNNAEAIEVSYTLISDKNHDPIGHCLEMLFSTAKRKEAK